MHNLNTFLTYAWKILRPVLGWLCIVLGIAGLVLPILQGTLLLALGIALVGRRNWLIRWVSVHSKLLLRQWAAAHSPVVAVPGQWLLKAQQHFSRQRRRLVWKQMERRRAKHCNPCNEGV